MSIHKESEVIRRFALTSREYLPFRVQLLFIAEAPPALRANRFFYFADVTRGDTLFLEMMKVLYPNQVGFAKDSFVNGRSAEHIRMNKRELLGRFCADGNYLTDAYAVPMPHGASSTTKAALMRSTLPELRGRLEKLPARRETPIILIGGITFDVCADPLRSDGWNVVNNAMINHPSRGGQVQFRFKLGAVLRSLKTLPSDAKR